MLTQAQFRALAARARLDALPFMASAITISTKQQAGQAPVMKLTLNPPQLKVEAMLRAQREQGMPGRVIVLKARQPGISTYCCAKNLVTKLTQPFAQTITVAHIEDAAEKLFRREKFMVERLPEGIRPKLAIERKNELLFKHIACSDGEVELSSTGSTGYATGKPIWRGMTIHGVHLSEFAFFGLPASDVLLGVMQSVPDSPDSYVVIESTANGMGNPFQEEWARAEDGESGFAPVFIGWWELPDAVAAVPEDFRLESDEKQFVKAYGLSAAQVQWRRNTLYTRCQGNLDLFQQEYPGSAAEAFLVTGRPAFPVPVLRKMHERALKVEPRRGVLDLTQTEPRRQFVARQDGELAIWRWPEPDHLYVIGADAAEGTEDGDFSAAAVVDRTTQQMVAMWHGKRSPIPFAHALMDLGAFYYGAMLAPEISGGCLAGDSKVATPSGDVPIRDLVGTEPWVFGNKDGRVVLARASRVYLARPDAECLRVRYTWQAGRAGLVEDTLVCTPEHPWLLRDGTYRRTDRLAPGDRLMPFFQAPWQKRRAAAPRIRLKPAPKAKWVARAKWVWEALHGPVPPGHHVHHRDENPLNDHPENLESRPGDQHNAEHSAAWFRTTDSERIAERAAKIKASWEDPAIRAARRAGQQRVFATPENRARRRELADERRGADGRFHSDNHTVVSVEPAGRHDVFNLTVPDVENFSVNGVVVHNHGFSVIDECKARGYYNLYQWQRTDRVKNTTTNFFGWMTTSYSRPLLFDTMHYALTNGDLMIWCPGTIMEMLAVRYVESRPEGEEHDDRVFALMIAWLVHLQTPMGDGQLPRMVRGEAKRPGPPDGPPLRNVERQVWAEIDQELKRGGAGRAPLSSMGDLVVTDDELAEGSEETADMEMPPGGWW